MNGFNEKTLTLPSVRHSAEWETDIDMLTQYAV